MGAGFMTRQVRVGKSASATLQFTDSPAGTAEESLPAVKGLYVLQTWIKILLQSGEPTDAENTSVSGR